MPDDFINKVTVYKLKVNDFSSLDFSNYDKVKDGTLDVNGASFPYRLYFLRQGMPVKANWLSLFSSLQLSLTDSQTPKLLFAGFIFIVKIGDSFFGVSGGLGHIAITKNPIEPRFGLILAQKIISLSELKGLIQRDTGGEVNFLDRVFRTAYNPEGDLQNLRRVLTNIRGKLKKENEYFEIIGSSIKAGDSITVTGRKSLEEIIKFLVAINELWHSETAKIKIPQLEYIQKKFYPELLIQLEKELINIISNYNNQPVDYLFLDNLELGYLPDRAERYELTMGRRKISVTSYEDVFRQVASILQEAADDERISAFRKINIKVYFDDNSHNTFALSKLVCGDINFNNDIYFINDGLWYHASSAFVQDLESELENIPYVNPEDLNLNEWTSGADEDGYNEGHTNLAVFHRKLIYVTEERGGIEFCDLLKSGDFIRAIHVKKACGAELRALFAQGYVAAKLYSDNRDFREKVLSARFGRNGDEQVSDSCKEALRCCGSKFKREISIIFAIYDDTPSHKVENEAKTVTKILKGTLSVFAKVDLISRVVSLRQLGYDVALTRIKPFPA